ncbi:MAG: ATP-binding protein [Candidatus Dormibacteraceae bacterium]
MRRFASTTRGRLAMATTLVLLVAAAIVDSAIYVAFDTVGASEADASLTAQASALGVGLQESESGITFQGGQVPGETLSGVAVDVAAVTGSGISQTAGRPLPAADLMQLARRVRAGGRPVWAVYRDRHGNPRRAFAESMPGSQGSADVLIVSRSLAELQSSLQRLLTTLVATSVLVILIGALLAYWLAGRVLRPVRTIAETARSLSERDLHRRVEVKVPSDELGELVTTFNGMLGRLEASFESLRHFTADASHELRTPLTLMRTEVEVALADSRSEKEYRRVLESVGREVDHLARLADQLLVLARADAGVLTPERAEIDVADLLHETAARWEATARRHRLKVVVEAPESGVLRADPALIRRVLDNLVDNALRLSPARATVTLRGRPETDSWLIQVADQGPGVAPALRAHLFTRFARADESRSPDGGAGLGLALSAAIAIAHGGSLRLLDSGPGATFELRVRDE